MDCVFRPGTNLSFPSMIMAMKRAGERVKGCCREVVLHKQPKGPLEKKIAPSLSPSLSLSHAHIRTHAEIFCELGLMSQCKQQGHDRATRYGPDKTTNRACNARSKRQTLTLSFPGQGTRLPYSLTKKEEWKRKEKKPTSL